MLVLGLAVATVLAAGCTAALRGSPAVDPVVASSLAAVRAVSTAPKSAGSTSRIRTPTTRTPPTTPTADRSTPTPPTGGTATHTGTARTVASVVHGIPVGAIVAELPDDPVYVEAGFQGHADELADLRDQVRTARTSGLNIWVVLLGHDVHGLTDVSNAIAAGAGGTAVVATTKSVSVSSSRFSQRQLTAAEHRVADVSSGVRAASVLVDQFRTMAAGGSTTASKTPGSSARQVGPILSLRSFQLADHSIGCLISGGAVRCDVMVKHSYTPPKNPHPRCAGDYGSSIRMPPGRPASFVCVSDTAYDPHAPVLPDGASTRVGRVMCSAVGATVTCMNLSSAHGFVIGPRVYSLF